MNRFRHLSRSFGAGEPSRRVAYLVALLLAGHAAPALTQDPALPGPYEVLRAAGIRPVDPPSGAIDLELERLEGGTAQLSDYHGDWLLLTFFATWCAPCVDELPTVEKLFKETRGVGQSVVAVSIDDRLPPVNGLVERLGLSLPVLWDSRGVAATTYRAESIPLSYLIGPDGRLYGVVRGSRDWTRAAPLLAELRRLVPPGDHNPRGYESGDIVDLPLRLTPPSADLRLSALTPAMGRPFDLEVRIRWAGNFDEYLLHPPQVTLPTGVVQHGVSASTSGEAGASVVTYEVHLEAQRAGTFALDPVELRYTPRFENQVVSTRLDGPTITVAAPSRSQLVIFGISATGLVLLVSSGWLWRRRRARCAPSAQVLDIDSWQGQLDAARRLRLQGQAGEALRQLLELERSMCRCQKEAAADWAEPLGEAQSQELESWVERCRFGGETPPSEAMQRLERRIERRLQQARPSPDQDRRASLRLGDEAL